MSGKSKVGKCDRCEPVNQVTGRQGKALGVAESPVRADLEEVLQGQRVSCTKEYPWVTHKFTNTHTCTERKREKGREGKKGGREGTEEVGKERGNEGCNSIFNLRILTLPHISRVISIAYTA